jgi:hypothetical protein
MQIGGFLEKQRMKWFVLPVIQQALLEKAKVVPLQLEAGT